MKLTYEQEKLIGRLSRIDNINTELSNKQTELLKLLENIENKNKILKKYEEEIKTIINEKTRSFPWLSKVISDYIELKNGKIANWLERKSYPAYSAAYDVRNISKEKRIITEQLLIANYTVDYYESLFPFLTEFKNENIDDLLLQVAEDFNKPKEEKEDPVKVYVTQGEYNNLSITERNQKALDRYLQSRKTSFQIGRDYERYIGYLFETNDYEVNYFGIQEGLEDLGRDLICKKNGTYQIVQCKCWSQEKTIHEKHINQLFGTTVKFYIDQINRNTRTQLSVFPELLKEGKITASFYTTTKLSETAHKFATTLGIKIVENFPLKPYPVIKCHTSKLTGEKIYHLPFDQMYDRTIIEKKYKEFYAWSVKEAEKYGFRRAWKWRGNE